MHPDQLLKDPSFHSTTKYVEDYYSPQSDAYRHKMKNIRGPISYDKLINYTKFKTTTTFE